MSSVTSNEERIRKDRILALSLGEGIKYGIGGFLVAGIATVVASMRSKKFDKFMSVSAKSSIPLMTGVGLFGFKFEMTMYDSMIHPERWGLLEYVEKGKVTSMPYHHRVLNYCYDNPFVLVSGLGFPFAGVVLYKNMQLTHLTFSQKIMHSRVYAQAGVISILLTTMFFREYMEKRGRFPEPDDE
eukprot:gene12341-16552_t